MSDEIREAFEEWFVRRNITTDSQIINPNKNHLWLTWGACSKSSDEEVQRLEAENKIQQKATREQLLYRKEDQEKIERLEAENKKMLEALEDSEETLKYVLQYFEGKAMSAEDDIKYSLKLIKQALREGE